MSFLYSFFVTHTNIFYYDYSISFYKLTSAFYIMFCYLLLFFKVKIFLRRNSLVPLHCRRNLSVWSVSYYAFFKEWLPPSLSSDDFRYITSFCTKNFLWGLIRYSRLFPSWHTIFALYVSLSLQFFQLLVRHSELIDIQSFSFPSINCYSTFLLIHWLYLNTFRRIPAITMFD